MRFVHIGYIFFGSVLNPSMIYAFVFTQTELEL